MVPAGAGWFEIDSSEAHVGARCRFLFDGGIQVPDPASRANPDDAHGPSMVVDPLAFDWQDAGWRGRPWDEAVIHELHVGAFTPAGSFVGVQQRLDYLREPGITAIELMPVDLYRTCWRPGAGNHSPTDRHGWPGALCGRRATAAKRRLDTGRRKVLHLSANLGSNRHEQLQVPRGRQLYASHPALNMNGVLPPWSVVWALEQRNA